MPPIYPTMILLLLLTLSACSSGQPRGTASSPRQELGKINIYYEFTATDGTAPPAAFNVKRSDSPKGPFSQVNSGSIAAKTGAKAGDRQLLLSDEGLPMGRDYYYYIERVDPRGIASKATSVARASVTLPLLTPAKVPSADTAPTGARSR